MIYSILYYIFLILFTKLGAFRKARSKLKPNQTIAIGLFTFIIFLHDCYNIYTNPDFISPNRQFDEKGRKFALIFFIAIFTSITLFLFSDYQRKQFKNIKPPQGFKGPRGKKGEEGAKGEDKCDRRGCKEEIIYNKIINFVNEVYRDYVKEPKVLRNNYLKNKIKLIVGSQQFKEYEERTSFDETMDEVKSKWKECIEHILDNDHGETFLQNPIMDDNDFSYLLAEDEKSPFDEIKKYDLWYWGEPKSSEIKVQYRCDLQNENLKLKVVDSNQYDLVWRSATAKQTVKNETYKPYQQKGNLVSIYRPKIITTNQGVFYPTGDLVLKGDIDEHTKDGMQDVVPNSERDPNKTYGEMGDPADTVELISGDFKHPDKFSLLFSAHAPKGSVGEGTYAYSFWKPEMNEENSKKYVCGDLAVSNNLFNQEPSKLKYACPPKSKVNEELTKSTVVYTAKDNKEDINVHKNKDKNISLNYKKFVYKIDEENDKIESEGNWKYLPYYNDEKYSITAKLKKRI